MKPYFWAAALFLVLAGCSRELPPGQHNDFRRFGIARGAFHYEFFGVTRGTEDIYFDHFGLREANLIHSEFITEKGFRPTITDMVRNGAAMTVVDSLQGIEVRSLDPMFDSLFRLPESKVPTTEEQLKRSYESIGYSLTGDTTVLGLPAHVWTQHSTGNTITEWRGISLGTHEGVPGVITELHLLSFDTTNVDTTKFHAPSGFPVRDLTKMKPGEAQ